MFQINGTIPTTQILLDNLGLNSVQANKGLIIQSDQPIQCVYSLFSVNNQDILQIQGQAALGRSFYGLSQTDMNAGGGSAQERHFISVMATEDNTQVVFTIPNTAILHNGTVVTVNLTQPVENTTSPLALPVGGGVGRTVTVTLNRGETYMVATQREDMTVTGIRITSDKDIVVNSGSNHTPTSQGGDQDAGFQQIVPAIALENTYV